MKELRLEWQFFAAPQCTLGQEPDCPIMVIVNIPEIVGQAIVRRFVWLGGKLAGHLPHDSPVEWRRLGVRASEKAGRGNRYQCGSGEEISAVHEKPRGWERRCSATQCPLQGSFFWNRIAAFSAAAGSDRVLTPQRVAYPRDNIVPLTLFRSRIVDHYTVHGAVRPVAAIVPHPVFANAGYDEKLRRNPLRDDAGRRVFLR